MTIHDATKPTTLLEQVVGALRLVADPEVGLNVVDLGLIYDIREQDGAVDLTFTLTNPMCPVHEVLSAGMRRAVLGVKGVRQCLLHLSMTPAWNPSMISPEGQRILGSIH